MKLPSELAHYITLLCLLITAPVASANTLDALRNNGILKVAVPEDFPPFGSVDSHLRPQGYDIDMARYLSQQLHVDLRLIPVSSANRIPYLQTGKVDLIISSMGKNAERSKAIDFTAPYAPFFLGVFGTSDLQISRLEELKGRTVGVTRGSVEDLALTEQAPAETIIKRFEDNNATLSSYLSGQVSLIATGNLIVSEVASRDPENVPETKFLLKNSPCYIGLAKNQPALLKEINRLIEKARNDGVLEAYSQQWLKAPFPENLDV